MTPLVLNAHLVSTGLGPLFDGIGHLIVTPEDLLPVIALALLAGLGGKEYGRLVLFVLPAAWLAGGLIGLAVGWSAPLAATGLFESLERPSFPWTDRVSTREYVELLETHSDHATLPDAVRQHLLEGVAELMDAAGGEIDVHYETVVHLARRSGST